LINPPGAIEAVRTFWKIFSEGTSVRPAGLLVLAGQDQVAGSACKVGASCKGRKEVLVIAFLGEARLHFTAKTLEAIVHDQVHDARNGIRSIYRRGAARDRFHAAEQD
jgi:hypothetical protein